jgi:hypothetical protein
MISEQALRDVRNAAIIEIEINQSGASCRPEVLAAVDTAISDLLAKGIDDPRALFEWAISSGMSEASVPARPRRVH